MKPDLDSYDYIIVAFSGGKDSIACALHLVDLGVPRDKIELWHHDVDGREGSHLMDWPVTADYCRKVAQALDVRLFFSWKAGGFEGEMLRDKVPTRSTRFEMPVGDRDISIGESGGNGPAGTRLKFPQVSPDLTVRWCSPYLKIDVGISALRNQARFNHRRTLFVTGERAEESASRAKYKTFEPHRSDGRVGKKRRHVDHWRPVHAWSASDVWASIERHRINPHPAYRLGFGRVSCAVCIFGNADQMASARVAVPDQFRKVAEHEARFGVTIKRKLNVVQTADAGTVYQMGEADLLAARSRSFDEPAIAPEWKLPRGAYADSCGPT